MCKALGSISNNERKKIKAKHAGRHLLPALRVTVVSSRPARSTLSSRPTSSSEANARRSELKASLNYVRFSYLPLKTSQYNDPNDIKTNNKQIIGHKWRILSVGEEPVGLVHRPRYR